MSRIALTPNASGTGTFTIAAPGTNTDRTLTLPDATGTVNVSGLANQVPAGSAGAPSIYPTGDTDTGVYFPGANQVGIAVGGAQRVLVSSTNMFLSGQLDITGTTGYFLNMYKPDYSTGFAAVDIVNDGRLRFTPLNSALDVGAVEIAASLYVNGSVGTSGQVLTSGGSGAAPSWASVGTATAGLAYGAVGTYAYLNLNSTSSLTAGTTYAGSSLSPAGSYASNALAAGVGQTSGAVRGASTLSGTWQLMGSNESTAAAKQNVFLRIS